MAHKRITRPTSEREGPQRNRARGARADDNTPNSTGPTIAAAVDSGFQTARLLVESADAAVKGAVERGVDTAYTVIEEYMLRGQAAARRFEERTNRREPVSERRPNGNDDWAAQWGPMSAMMVPWMQMMRVWTESMTSMMPGNGTPADWMNAFMPGAAAMTGAGYGRRNVTVRVESASPAAVTVELDAGAEFARLSVEPLQPGASGGAALTGATIDATSGRVTVGLNVSAAQPAGTYTGAIHDSTGAKRGELIVVLEGAPARARRRKA